MGPALEPPALPRTPPRRVPRGFPILAWVVLALVVGAIAVGQQFRSAAEQKGKRRADTLMTQAQVRYLVGVSRLPGGGALAPQLYRDAKQTLDRGSVEQRLAVVVLAGELVGPGEALDRLRELRRRWQEHAAEPAAATVRSADLLEELYRGYERQDWAASGLTADERRHLRDDLGSVGELALAPADGPDAAARSRVVAEARGTAAVILGVTLAMLGLGFAGVVALTGLAVCAAVGYVRPAFHAGSPVGGVYAETFVLWIVLFSALGLAAALPPLREHSLLVGGLLGGCSLAVLGWPVLRGVPWRQVRYDLGLYAGRHPLREVGWGVVCYAASLPLLAVGVLLMFGLMRLQQWAVPVPPSPFGPGADPSHPIVGLAAQGGWWVKAQIFFAAVVGAPVVEEVVFRGVLYRHLREVAAGWGRWLSVPVSGGVVAFIFAVIHPQGWVAVPPLMALALGFALAREWRGTLVPCVVAHACNNGLISVLLFALI